MAQCRAMKHALLLSLLVAVPAHADLVTRKTDVGHRDFRHAKEVLPRVSAQTDFYCGCPYSGKRVDLHACGYVPRKSAKRAARMEWEHVVPAWVIGHQHQCWQSGGRDNCTRTDPAYARAEGDLVNLVPAVGEINGDRSNFGYGIWTADRVSQYGQCQTAIDFRHRMAQPRPEVRGQIARIQMYMSQTYALRLSSGDRRLFCAWAVQYPVTDAERSRDQRIAAVQGTGNRFVSVPQATGEFCGS
jgi:deoxyribonuclease-1